MSPSGKNKGECFYPLGIRFWMEVDRTKVPHFEVYECYGRMSLGESVGWLFTSKRADKMMYKSFEDLQSGGDFKPFLMDMEKLRKRYGEI